MTGPPFIQGHDLLHPLLDWGYEGGAGINELVLFALSRDSALRASEGLSR